MEKGAVKALSELVLPFSQVCVDLLRRGNIVDQIIKIYKGDAVCVL